MNFKAVLFLFLIYAANNIEAQNLEIKRIGVPFIHNYAPIDYNGSSQNWQIIKDKRGVLYVANNSQLLEYDGSTWRTIIIPNTSVIRSLTMDKNGRIYIGSSGQIGYLLPDQHGSMQYVSLNEKIPEAFKTFSDVFRTHSKDSSIIFTSFQNMLIFDNDTITPIGKPNSTAPQYFLTHKMGNRIFITDRSKGLMELVWKEQKYKLISVKGGEFLNSSIAIYAILPKTKEDALIFTRSGTFIYNYEESSFEPWKTEANDWLNKNNPSYGVKMKNGNYAIGTYVGGILITNDKGEIIQILNKDKGLVDNLISHIFCDESNNLWVCTDNGISYIETGSYFTSIGPKIGLEGQPLSFLKTEKYFYVGTGQGLFYALNDDLTNPLVTNPFQMIKGTETQNWYLNKFKDVIICGNAFGAYQIKDAKIVKHINGNYIWDFQALNEYADKLVACNYSGEIFLFDISKGELTLDKKIGDTGKILHNIAYQGKRVFLAANNYNDVIRFTLDKELSSIENVRSFTVEDGLPAMNGNNIFDIDGQTLIGTSNGIYNFDISTNRFQIEPKFIKTAENRAITYLIKNSIDKLIINFHENLLATVAINGSDTTFCDYCFNDLRDKSVYKVFALENEELLFGGSSQLVHYKGDSSYNYFSSIPSKTLIRSVEFLGQSDSLLFGGTHRDANSSPISIQTMDIPNYDSEITKLRFTFASLSLKNPERNIYSYKLDGQDEFWSSWSDKTIKEYTNLAPGDYIFKVKSKNFYRYESDNAEFKFSIYAPWYLTNWAYAFYILFSIFVVWIIVRMNSIRLKQENEKLENTILERTEEIRYQAEKLQTLDNAKSRFFANISHELRTPLTLIQGPLESILNGSLGQVSDTVKSNLDLSRASTKKLLNLVEEILDLSKLEAGKLELKLESVKFSDLINRIFYTYQSSSEAKRIELKLDYNLNKELIFKIDIGKLEKILDNLLSNAIKFTDAGGEIRMIINQVGEKIKLQVVDNGIGIDKSELNQIFDRFYQAGKENKYSGGTGIGLSLANELTELMDGKLELDSELNMGTTFTLTIPLIVGSIEEIKEYQQDELAKIPQPIEIDFGDPTKFKNARILIVEDNEMMRMYIKKQMSSQYQVDEAEDGIEALDQIAQHKYDLIITDLMMPRLDGYDLVAKLREKENTKDISIIMLTARAADEDIVEGLHIGVDDYMTKPFNPTELKARVHNILSNRSSRLESDKDEQELSANDKLVLELKQTILDSLTDRNFNVSVLAEKSAISERQLNRNIKKITGLTAGNFIREVRLNEARILLEHKTYNTIAEVCYAVGFEKPGYFSEIYTKRFGKRPADYFV